MKVQQELMRPRFNPDDDECLWASDVFIEAGSEWGRLWRWCSSR